ncbi:hypothetical protein BTS2_3356 [Bacillus sp. TS-2]|nr:hypothetical protein BTS2_3356 [Bacillus sp. TS-2]
MSSNISLKKWDWIALTILPLMLLALIFVPDISLAATTAQVQNKLRSGVTAIQLVLSGVVVIIAIVAGLKIISKHLPGIDDPHTKNEMWKSLANVGYAVAGAAALIWILPWVYNLFR